MSRYEAATEYAKAYMERYLIEKKRIRRIVDQIGQLNDILENISVDPTSEKVQSTPQPDKIGAIVAKISDLKDEKADMVLKSIDIMEETEAVISKVENVDYQLLLQLRYISGKPWYMIADEMYYSERWIRELHYKALAEVDKVIGSV